MAELFSLYIVNYYILPSFHGGFMGQVSNLENGKVENGGSMGLDGVLNRNFIGNLRRNELFEGKL